MTGVTWFLTTVLLPLQVPAPTSAQDLYKELRSAHSGLLSREKTELEALGKRLAAQPDNPGFAVVTSLIASQTPGDGPTHFRPLPELVPPRAGGPRYPWQTELDTIREKTANELLALAKRAADGKPPHLALASQYVREAVDRAPDHREARRLIGYVPYQGGWARPFAVSKLASNQVRHPVFGWVDADWVPQLDQGKLPALRARGSNKVRWLPTAEADQLRAGWNPPWHIFTEHFEIQTSVSLAETISFGRRLEAFHDLFIALMADVIGPNLPLARRFKDPKLSGDPTTKRHLVYFFGSKEDYIAYFRNRPDGPDLEKSLGYYEPPKSGSGGRGIAYFFRDPDGQLPVTATLYHEVSHQLLFENAGPNAYMKNVGNYWVFEGLGTYFETVQELPDGSLEVGGLVGRRMEEAIKAIVFRAGHVPLGYFIQFDQARFNREPEVYLHYQEAMALATFLMQWHDGEYREPFLAYVRDAYRGTIKRNTGRPLQDRLGVPYSTLEGQFLAYLKTSVDLTRTEPEARGTEKTMIRSVPVKNPD
jgi:hypothetical protein